MQAPRILRRINRAVTNPLIGTFAGQLAPFAVVVHTGRRSGRTYRTPVLAFATRDGFVSPLPYGTDTDWLLNLQPAGRCTLESRGTSYPVTAAAVVDAEDALQDFPGPLRAALSAAHLPGYLRMTTRDALTGADPS